LTYFITLPLYIKFSFYMHMHLLFQELGSITICFKKHTLPSLCFCPLNYFIPLIMSCLQVIQKRLLHSGQHEHVPEC